MSNALEICSLMLTHDHNVNAEDTLTYQIIIINNVRLLLLNPHDISVSLHNQLLLLVSPPLWIIMTSKVS